MNNSEIKNLVIEISREIPNGKIENYIKDCIKQGNKEKEAIKECVKLKIANRFRDLSGI